MGLVECDRGTELGLTAWHAKCAGYADILNMTEDQRKALIGHKQARVVVITPNRKRLEDIEKIIINYFPRPDEHSPLWKFWLTTQDTLQTHDLSLPLWKQAGHSEMQPLVPLDRL